MLLQMSSISGYNARKVRAEKKCPQKKKVNLGTPQDSSIEADTLDTYDL